jgi:hypothetical protein
MVMVKVMVKMVKLTVKNLWLNGNGKNGNGKSNGKIFWALLLFQVCEFALKFLKTLLCR